MLNLFQYKILRKIMRVDDIRSYQLLFIISNNIRIHALFLSKKLNIFYRQINLCHNY